ncbi:MAG: Crp/Fnr family transcriptional regulator [Bdellovibrionota bacterium]
MGEFVEESKRFMVVVDSDTKHLNQLLDLLHSAYPEASLVHEADPRAAIYRMQNVPPDVVVTIAGELDKNFTGLQLINSILQNPALRSGIVLLAETAIPENFTMEVLRGRLSVCARPIQPGAFLRATAHALNYRHNKIFSNFEVHSLQEGELLFLEGDKANMAYLVKSGKLRASRSRDGETQVLGEILPGEFVGEMAYINGDPRSANVMAIENAELIQIPLNVFESLLFTKPNWSMAMMKTLSKRLKVANK